MPKEKLVNISSKNRNELINNIMRSLFEERVKTLTGFARVDAQAIMDRRQPEFLKYYADKELRPFLNYSESCNFLYKTSNERETHYLLAPKMTQNIKGELKMETGQSRYCSNEGAQVCVLARANHHDTPILSESEFGNIQQIIGAGDRLQAEFDSVRANIVTVVGVFKTLRAFYEAYPELKTHARLADAEVVVPPLPVPVHSAVIGQLTALGLIAS